MKTLESKLNNLKKILKETKSALLAFSGGVDSTFLLKMCKDILADKIIAAISDSHIHPSLELKKAQKIAQRLEIECVIVRTGELSQAEFVNNPPERCYFCKKELFSKLERILKKKQLDYILDGSNYDDLSDFRPGRIAAQEFNVRSPLAEAKLSKEDIRMLSKEIGLSTWNKPSSPCLATRIPYGIRISGEKLRRIEQAEQILKDLGINQVRVRDYCDIARIEVPKENISLFLQENISKKVVDGLKDIGYIYVTLDLQGYKMGNMNNLLKR